MKIAQIVSSFPLPDESPYLGPENVVSNLVRGIKEIDSNVSVDIIAIRNDINTHHSYQLIPDVMVHFFPRKKYLSRSIGDPLIIKKLLKENNYDLIHSHYPGALANSSNINTPKIFTLHGMFQKEKQYQKNPFIKFAYHDVNTYLFKKIVPILDGFVAVSPFIVDELKEMGSYDKINRIFQINNPIDNSFFNVNFNQKNNIILYPARISKLKNQLAAIKSLSLIRKEINDVKLLFAGDTNDDYLKLLRKAAMKKDLCNHIEFLGKVDKKRMINLYFESSLVQLFSNYETQSLVISEAMATGNPVISANTGNLPYLVKNGETGYIVEPDDYISIAKYSIELLRDNELNEKMGKTAKKIATTDFNPLIIARKTLSMYREVIETYD